MHENFLRQMPMFAKLTDIEISELAQTVQPRQVSAGTILCLEGTLGDRAYIIVSGQVDVSKDLAGDERILNRGGAGDFIGEMSLFYPNGLRTASARAYTDVEVLELAYADLDHLLHRHPATAYEILRELSLRLRDTDEAIIRDLQAKNVQLRLAQAQIIEKEKLEHELNVAARIQRSILPTELPHFPGLEIGYGIDSARMVGGDFFDIIPLGDQRIAITIGDVSDKGVPAAIFMALCRSLIRAEAHPRTTPRRVLQRVNQHLLGMNEMGMFVTVLYGVLDLVTHRFRYARAGHEVPLIFKANGAAHFCSPGRGQLLGILPEPELNERTIGLDVGDTFLLYTDGVPDALDEAGQRLGYADLMTLAADSLCCSAQDTCDAVLRTLQLRQGNTLQFDDMMVVAGRITQ